MTSETELQGLSREAAGCLPREIRGELQLRLDGYLCGDSNGEDWRVQWLHESTEACTEIMVRVLWPAGVALVPGIECVRAIFEAGDSLSEVQIVSDPMRVYRVAVLKALIALKG